MLKKQIFVISIILLLFLILSGCNENTDYSQDKGKNNQGIIPETHCTTIAEPDPAADGITWTLPDCASSLRLSLPASLDDIFYNSETGITGYGVHAGGHIEGLDHPWIHIKKGTPVKSWANGTVLQIQEKDEGEYIEYMIGIDYGYGLTGTHGEIMTPFVEVGDVVACGQEVGLGLDFGRDMSSAEFYLVDVGRDDGVFGSTFGQGCTVSPFDYLVESEKQALVDAYKEHVLELYLAGNLSDYTAFYPYQPYLTNADFLHKNNEGKITGEWYSLQQWDFGYPNDVITFIETNNIYSQEYVVLSMDYEEQWPYPDYFLNGEFEVDYTNNHILITGEDGSKVYCLFEIDESGERAQLKIEYQEDSYPSDFSDNALEYIERSNIGRAQEDIS
jgi:hypothetical protein